MTVGGYKGLVGARERFMKKGRTELSPGQDTKGRTVELPERIYDPDPNVPGTRRTDFGSMWFVGTDVGSIPLKERQLLSQLLQKGGVNKAYPVLFTSSKRNDFNSLVLPEVVNQETGNTYWRFLIKAFEKSRDEASAAREGWVDNRIHMVKQDDHGDPLRLYYQLVKRSPDGKPFTDDAGRSRAELRGFMTTNESLTEEQVKGLMEQSNKVTQFALEKVFNAKGLIRPEKLRASMAIPTGGQGGVKPA